MTTKYQILDVLYRNKGRYVSGEAIAAQLKVSRTAIWKHIQTLQKEGYNIDSSTKLGYRLVRAPDSLLPYEIKRGLKTRYIGHKIRYFKEVNSTNDAAKTLAAEGAEEGTVIIAESQSSGRGRLGKKWVSPSGGIWMSLLLRPKINITDASKITMITGIAVAKTIRGFFDLDAKIKWPNDILINDKKVCGILTEISTEMNAVDYIVIGIGIDANVDVSIFPPELREGATSLRRELGRDVPRAEFVQKLLEEFERTYDGFNEHGFRLYLEEWRKLSDTLGRKVQIKTLTESVEGEAIGVDKDGELIVELPDGSLKRVIAGECIYARNS